MKLRKLLTNSKYINYVENFILMGKGLYECEADGKNLLTYAAEKNNIDAMKLFLRAGLDINAMDKRK